MRGGQYQDFPSKKILSHSAEKSSKGTLKSFTNFGNRKNFCSRGLCHDIRFSVAISCLTVPKNFIGEPFCAVFHKIFGSEKVYALEWGGVPRFSVEKFLSQCRGIS